MVSEHQADYPSQCAAIGSIAGCATARPPKKKRIKALERENRELKRANKILRKRPPCCPIGPRPPTHVRAAFIDDYRDVYGVAPICRVVPIAPSTYRAIKAKRADPARQSRRAQRDAALLEGIRRVWKDNLQVYGVRKVWRALQRAGWEVARCTVERLMQQMRL